MIKLTEYIVRAIENTYIVEMAYDRKKYKDAVNDLAYQLYENWCLIRYATLSNNMNDLKNHWRKELISHIDNICKMSLKFDKKAAIREVFIGWIEFKNNDDNRLIHMLAKKFNDENIDIEDDKITDIVNDWIEYGCDELIDVLSVKTNKYNYNDVVEYVNSI